MLLQAWGHDLRVVYDGPPALDMARQFHPQVILLDIGLPSLDGFAVAAQLRAEPDLGPLVVIAMTGYGQDTDRQRSLAAGFDHHLVKPTNLGLLQEMLAGLMVS